MHRVPRRETIGALIAHREEVVVPLCDRFHCRQLPARACQRVLVHVVLSSDPPLVVDLDAEVDVPDGLTQFDLEPVSLIVHQALGHHEVLQDG